MMGHGKGVYTLYKEALFSNCLGLDMRVQNASFYFVFDLNGGTGINRVENGTVRGSSIIAFDKLKACSQSGAVYSCEKDRKRARELHNRLASNVGLFPDLQSIYCEVVHGDNREFVEHIPEIIFKHRFHPRNAKGVIIADPDGPKVPVDRIRQVLQSCPNFSVLVHLSGYERVNRHREKHPERYVHSDCVFIDELLKLKPYGLISERLYGNGHFILFLANYPLKNYQPPGCPWLYATDYPEGVRLLERLR